ncbi:hypothetical protein FHU33_0293 [Blastococcus colisei]|uniref:Acyl-CoA thioesterase n=1 Tax=Blastococcus colisei TaxID=1564162 RepID=A0A543PA33_9ACTN|nr:hypothetical protein [Blastococcus colisei]TQN40941.1 hypothetical protein FHU33_0293 [Blastococcus colisei]
MPTLTVAGRFCGPPGTANGGYLAGRLAALTDSSTVSVRLRRPTPLDRPLDVRPAGTGVELLDGDEVLAVATPAELDLEVPAAPSPAEAAAAQAALPPRTGHPFPRCFGCGPERTPGEAVAVFVGPLPDRPDLWAGVFRPTAELPSSDGAAAPETVWAALDCPSFQPIAPLDSLPHLLGTITARQDTPVRLDTDHVVLSWVIGREGRRSTTASALIGPDGEVCARAQALWFAMPPS